MAGGTQRGGPSHWNGDARSLQTGSARMLRPPIWMRKLEWPIHVTMRSVAGARGGGDVFLASGKRAAKSRRLIAWAGRVNGRAAIHLSAAPTPGSSPADPQGFANEP